MPTFSLRALLVLEKKIFKCFTIYGHDSQLVDTAKPFEQIVNILSTESTMWNLVKTVKAASEKKTFKDFTILYTYMAKGQGQIAPKTLTVAKQFYYFNHTL